VWPILTSTSLTRHEIVILQEVGFQLQDQPPISPQRLFTMSNVFEVVLYNHPIPLHIDSYPTTRWSKPIRHIAISPTTEYCNKSESTRNMKGTILGVTILLLLGLRAIITLQSGTEPQHKVYRITLGMYPECTCPHFIDMAISTIGGCHQYVNCKHLYYLFHYFCNMNVVEDNFIHSPSFNFSEVKHLFIRASIINILNVDLLHTK